MKPLDKYDLRAPIAKKGAGAQSHFLSVIAFDGNVTMNTFDSVMLAQHEHKLWAGWKVHAGEGQVRSRNECAHLFLAKTPCTHHFFCDADVMFQPRHVKALRAHPEAADSIIVGLYAKKQPEISYPFNSLKGGNPEPNARGLMEVSKAGTGFMQIPRTAYEKIMAKFPERVYKCDYDIDENGVRADRFSFFFHDIRLDTELGFMRDQSEDWAFCEMARAAGVKIYVDVTTTAWVKQDEPCILHRGLALYPLQTEMQRLDLEQKLKEAHDEIAKLKGERGAN